MSTISSFKDKENKHDVYRSKDCMNQFYEFLRERIIKIINFKNRQQESYENANIFYICKEKFEDKYAKDKKYRKVIDHCHYTGEYRDAASSI